MNAILISVIFSLHQASSQSFECITTSGLGELYCPENYEIVSCGYQTEDANTSFDLGAQNVGGSLCYARYDLMTFVYARCCNLAPYATSCDTIEDADNFVDIEVELSLDPAVDFSCPTDTQLFGCQQLADTVDAQDTGIFGVYALNSTQSPPAGIFELDNACTARRTSSVTPESEDNYRYYRTITCCNITMPDIFSFDCIGVSSGEIYWDGHHTFSIQCPSDSYTMTNCNGYSPFDLVNGAYIEDGTDECVVQRANDMNDTHYSVATAICCQLVTQSPTSNPTAMTMNPTIDPTDDSYDDESAEEEGEEEGLQIVSIGDSSSNDDSSSSESVDELRANEKRTEHNNLDPTYDDVDDEYKNENVVINLGFSFERITWYSLLFCVMAINLLCWVCVFKLNKPDYNN